MQKAILIALVVIIVLGSGLLLRFGTLSPCGLLKQELKADLLRSAFEKKPTDKWELAGIGLGAALVGPLIDSLVSSLTPMQCTQALVRLKFEGKNIFADDLARTVQNSPKYGSGYSVPIPPPRPDWRVSTEKSPVDGSTNVYLSIDAEKPISGWLASDITPSLQIRCKENKTNAYIHLGLRPKTEYGSYGSEQTSITLRFDEESCAPTTLDTTQAARAPLACPATPDCTMVSVTMVNCRATSGILIGQICHIESLSVGGPRYHPNKSTGEIL
jgi:hypothetical protein